jgi:predicted metal-dependent peptidase
MAEEDEGRSGQRQQEHIERALRQGEMAAKYAGHGSGMAEKLGVLQPPKVEWRKVLADFLTETLKGDDDSTWRRPARRGMAMDIYMPSRYTDKAGELVLALDTSGSISGVELGKMLAETASLCQSLHPEKVTLLYWDAAVARVEEYDPNQYATLVASTKPKGGGGTMVECVPEYMQKHNVKAQCAIVFTDGYLGGSWGNWSCPVLWVIVDNKQCQPPFGQVLHVSSGVL